MAEDEKLSDVAKPGKTVPDATSRPIIVGHGPRMKNDPMIQAAEKKPNAEVKDIQSSVQRNKIVAPVNQPPTEEADAKEAETIDPIPEDSSSDAASVDAVLDQATTKKKPPESEDGELNQEAKAHRQHVDKLISEKTYFLPIGQVTRKKKTQNSLLVLVLLIMVAAAGGFFAYQTGLLKSVF